MIGFSGIYTKAAVLVQLDCPLEVMEDVMVPLPERGQVLVKIHYAGLCHSQLMEIQGLRGEDKYLPHMLGHEGVGDVVKIGEGVTKVRVGDQVVLSWIKGNGLNVTGCQYQMASGMKINAGAVTTFSEYSIVSENRVVLKPTHTPSQLSVLYGCAIPTGLGMVLSNVTDTTQKSIAFLGLGGIGLSALLAAKLHHFKQVIVIDVNSEKLELAKTLGATHIINPKQSKLIEEVMRLTDGIGVDYCFESAGKASTIEEAFVLVRRNGGKCVFASHPPAGDKISLDPYEFICGKKIKGTWGGGVQPDCDVIKFDEYYRKGMLPLERLISKCYPLTEINTAVDDLKNQRVLRALISCGVPLFEGSH